MKRLITAIALCAACGSDGGELEHDGAPDAGGAKASTGGPTKKPTTRRDGGELEHDAGAHDAGELEHDAGELEHDAGELEHDAGAHDAGELERDAGTTDAVCPAPAYAFGTAYRTGDRANVAGIDYVCTSRCIDECADASYAPGTGPHWRDCWDAQACD